MLIAEAGTYHHADNMETRIQIAEQCIRDAAACGADVVKFQCFNKPTRKTMFCWIDGDEERSERWVRSRIDLAGWFWLKDRADEEGIQLLLSVFERDTAAWPRLMDLTHVKVASRAAMSFPYEEAIGIVPIVSNGMGLPNNVPNRAIIMDCEANYPSTALWNPASGHGFSDHSGDPWRAIAAIKAGCEAVEVHFHRDPERNGPDAIAALTLDELKLVGDVYNEAR